MALRKEIRSKQQYLAGYTFEKEGELTAAIKGYQKAVATDPMNIQAWNRQMILFRKSKTKLQEITLIKTAIAAYKKAIRTDHQNWLKENKEKAESSLELAKVLGLIEPGGIPKTEHEILEKWETRLYLMEYRVKNTRTKKSTLVKKASKTKLLDKDKEKGKTKRAKSISEKRKSEKRIVKKTR